MLGAHWLGLQQKASDLGPFEGLNVRDDQDQGETTNLVCICGMSKTEINVVGTSAAHLVSTESGQLIGEWLDTRVIEYIL